MSEARTLHTATRLLDGTVLVVGGASKASFTEATDTAEIFDPTLRKFCSVGHMAEARLEHSALLLKNGNVLIVGGYRDNKGSIREVVVKAELYDPNRHEFLPAGMMTAAREGFTATALDDGRVLIAGGVQRVGDTSFDTLNTAEIYDSNQGTFRPTGKMRSPRVMHAAVKLKDGRVLLTGGMSTFFVSPEQVLSSAELYDPKTETFSSVANMNTPRTRHFAILLDTARVLVGGGVANGSPFPTLDLYDPANATFTRNSETRDMPAQPVIAALPGNQVLVVGQFGQSYANAQIYDVYKAAFHPTLSRATATRIGGAASLLMDGTVLLTGGRVTAIAIDTAEIYQP